MESVRIEGGFQAVGGVCHFGSEEMGNIRMLNRQKFIINDSIEEIPIITGNSIRGYLRDLIMADFLELLGWYPDVNTLQGRKIFHALFSGGILENVKGDNGSINIQLKKEIYSKLPVLGLFGTAFGNQMIESKMKVDIAQPACVELNEVHSKDYQSTLSHYELVSNVFQTRLDKIKEADKEEDENPIQMKIEYEVFANNTKFEHGFSLYDCTDVEKSTFARMLTLWSERPHVGGKSSIGFSKLKLNYNCPYSDEEYLNFISENKESIIMVLEEMEGML